MSIVQSLYHTFQRYRTLQTDHISALPIVILVPHSACNCRCVMCDIWKGNRNLKQLSETDIKGLLGSLKKLGTQQVLMSGGEALLHPGFFRFCELLGRQKIRVTLLSSGLALKKNAAALVHHVNDIIVSLDGDEATHNYIRNIPDAYQRLREGVRFLKDRAPFYKITGRTVIHRLNFRRWPAIIDSAREMGLDQLSFLPADVSSHAFNRETAWNEERQHEVLPGEEELSELNEVLEKLIRTHKECFDTRFIAESPDKLRYIYAYYAACYKHNPFPYKKCNAPWVSVVVEADGTVRPCFFHAAIGNTKQDSLEKILNSTKALEFRKELDISNNSICMKCVCHLHLAPGIKLN